MNEAALALTRFAGATSIESALAPGVEKALERSDYLVEMERRFRGEVR